MDSMRSLNTSLPPAYSSRPAPPEQLLQAFKTAALSVTNLYKSAVTDQNNSRAAGYQDALDDLLRFLDSENLGLQDGEGWRVRQWATERYDGTANRGSPEAEDTRANNKEPARDEMQTEQEGASHSEQVPTETDDSRSEQKPDAPQSETSNPEPLFTFTAGTSAQNNEEMQIQDDTNNTQDQTEASSPPTIQVQVINRANRGAHRSNSSRHPARSSNRTQGSVAGTKRKLQVPDFFNISNLGPQDEGASGSKRSRLI